MPYTPVIELESFDVLPLNRRLYCLRALLEAMCFIDHQWLLENPSTPRLYQAVPQYEIKRRPFGLDRWYDIPKVMRTRRGDCKDFACWRIAELRMQGIPDVAPYIKVGKIRDITIYHVQVRIGLDIEDPSALLGMPNSVSYEELKR